MNIDVTYCGGKVAKFRKAKPREMELVGANKVAVTNPCDMIKLARLDCPEKNGWQPIVRLMLRFDIPKQPAGIVCE